MYISLFMWLLSLSLSIYIISQSIYLYLHYISLTMTSLSFFLSLQPSIPSFISLSLPSFFSSLFSLSLSHPTIYLFIISLSPSPLSLSLSLALLLSIISFYVSLLQIYKETTDKILLNTLSGIQRIKEFQYQGNHRHSPFTWKRVTSPLLADVLSTKSKAASLVSTFRTFIHIYAEKRSKCRHDLKDFTFH